MNPKTPEEGGAGPDSRPDAGSRESRRADLPQADRAGAGSRRQRKRRRGPIFGPVGRREFTSLLVIAVVAGGLWLFVILAGHVMAGRTQAFDEALLLAMRSSQDSSEPIGPPWLQVMARDVTALGGIGVLSLVTIATAVFLAMQRKYHAMLLLVLAVIGGWVIVSSLKRAFDRPRPDLVPHGSQVYSRSFPSGHSMMAAVTWLTLAALVARVEAGVRIKRFLLGMAVFVTVAVGVSRVYLGVHWPSDVLAGWTAGSVWAILCWFLARWLQRRGKVETAA